MEPRRDPDDLGGKILTGDLPGVQSDYIMRTIHATVSDATLSEDEARDRAAAELYCMQWGPTQVPIFNLILLSLTIAPGRRSRQISVAKRLIDEVKLPVDGVDFTTRSPRKCVRPRICAALV